MHIFPSVILAVAVLASSSVSHAIAPCGPPTDASATKGSDKGFVLWKDVAKEGKDKLIYKGTKGDALAFSELGDPVSGSTEWQVCIWETSNGGAVNTLLYDAVLPPSGICDEKPCWKMLGKASKPKGLLFKDPNRANAGGIKLLKVKVGTAGRSKWKIIAQGSNLPAAGTPLSQDDVVLAELRNTEGLVLQARFEAPAVKSKETLFKDKFKVRPPSPSPSPMPGATSTPTPSATPALTATPTPSVTPVPVEIEIRNSMGRSSTCPPYSACPTPSWTDGVVGYASFEDDGGPQTQIVHTRISVTTPTVITSYEMVVGAFGDCDATGTFPCYSDQTLRYPGPVALGPGETLNLHLFFWDDPSAASASPFSPEMDLDADPLVEFDHTLGYWAAVPGVTEGIASALWVDTSGAGFLCTPPACVIAPYAYRPTGLPFSVGSFEVHPSAEPGAVPADTIHGIAGPIPEHIGIRVYGIEQP